MTTLFDLGFGASIFFALALAVFFFVTRTPRAALQRIREVTYSDRHVRRSVPMGSNAGSRFMAMVHMVHWVRARLGLTADADMPERMANAGYKGTLPADLYTAARIFCPLLALIAAHSSRTTARSGCLRFPPSPTSRPTWFSPAW